MVLMKQRQVQDDENIIWDCVEAYSGLSPEMADRSKASDKDAGEVTVVCTPSGGAQTVRLSLPPDWLEEITDETLLRTIKRERD